MRILALETSSLHGSVAATDDRRLVGDRKLPTDRRTAQTLAPAIADLLAELNWRATDLDAVAVTVGPGSFTGLRIGVTTAKTLGYAADAKVIAVNTLEALAVAAAEVVPQGEAIAPMIDAHRGEFFMSEYRRSTESLITGTEVEIVDIDQWLAGDSPNAWLTGPILPKLADEIRDRWPDAKLCDADLWTPRASAVATIAGRKFAEGQFDDSFALVPNYYRPSYAEEKRKK